jgi:perosamine synthetase
MPTIWERSMTRVSHSKFRTLFVPPPGVSIRVPYSFMGAPYGEEELAAVRRVFDSHWLTTGAETVAFEQQWRDFHNVEYAFTMSSCTAALHVAAQLCRIREGDEVLTTPLTFVSTNQAVLGQGAVPVFVDVDSQTWNIDPEQITASITPRTKAIFVTHLAGQMCDMDPILDVAREHDLLVVEDCAHAQGARYNEGFAGSFGDIGCFSFHAIKNMTTLGEGGMITTGKDEFAVKIPWLRSMGSRYPDDPHDDGSPGPRPYEVDDVDGYIPGNHRMTEAQAAVGQAQLKKLPGFIARRREIAARYAAAIEHLDGMMPPYEDPRLMHTYHIYALMVDPSRAGYTASELGESLLRQYGVHCVNGLYRPSYLFALYRRSGLREGTCPTAERVAANTLQLPMYPQLTDEQVDHVINSLSRAHARLQR